MKVECADFLWIYTSFDLIFIYLSLLFGIILRAWYTCSFIIICTPFHRSECVFDHINTKMRARYYRNTSFDAFKAESAVTNILRTF